MSTTKQSRRREVVDAQLRHEALELVREQIATYGPEPDLVKWLRKLEGEPILYAYLDEIPVRAVVEFGRHKVEVRGDAALLLVRLAQTRQTSDRYVPAGRLLRGDPTDARKLEPQDTKRGDRAAEALRAKLQRTPVELEGSRGRGGGVRLRKLIRIN